MSSDTAELLKRHVEATKAMLANEKPDLIKQEEEPLVEPDASKPATRRTA